MVHAGASIAQQTQDVGPTLVEWLVLTEKEYTVDTVAE